MEEQRRHVEYTRHEWTTESRHIKMLDYLQDKQIEFVADIGANVGEVSKILLERIPSIKIVYAYEPYLYNFEFLRHRFAHEPKIHPIKRGIFYGKNNSPLYFNGGCGSFTIADFGKKREAEIGKHSVENVELVELENEGIHRLDLVKLDIEGSEYNVIEHSKFLKTAKYIIVEFHPFGMNDVEQFQKYLPTHTDPKLAEARKQYVKDYTDAFVAKHLAEYKIIVEDEVQYLLERKTEIA